MYNPYVSRAFARNLIGKLLRPALCDLSIGPKSLYIRFRRIMVTGIWASVTNLEE